MVTTTRRIEEKGQRTPRSKDTYAGERVGHGGSCYCDCGAVFENKRWHYAGKEASVRGGQRLVCPACRRTAERNPAGIVSLSGGFLTVHLPEIDRLLRKMADEALTKNPMNRVMEIRHNGLDGITVTTTQVKLAQKIGREVFKSFGGELQYHWSRGEELVRVQWFRQP